MISAQFINSPPAEKRLAVSIIRKELIGRRAYSDSIYGRKTIRGSENGSGLSGTSSSSSSSSSTPRREVSSTELNRMVYEVSVC